MRVLNVICLGGVMLTLAGCGVFGGNGNGFLGLGGLFGDGGAAEAGLPYNAKLTKGEDPRQMSISVSAGGVAVADVRESVRFAATRYCIETFGGSKTNWVIDPATGDWAFQREGEDMVFSGRCTYR